MSVYLLDEKLESEDRLIDLTDRVIRKINHTRKNVFEPVLLQKDLPDQFQIRLFHTKKMDPPTWRDFLKPILPHESPLLETMNNTHSFVCFIEHSNNIYVITGGTGSVAIERFVNMTFGLDILIRLIDGDEKVVKEIKERDVTGTVLGQTRFYRGDQSILSQDDFGKVFNLVSAALNKKILTAILGFTPQELKRKTARCVAKDSFKLFKSITFEQLLNLIQKFTFLLTMDEKYPLNKIRLISRRKPQNQALRKALIQHLIQKLYDDVRLGLEIDFDFCHTRYEDYHTANRYTISYDSELYFQEKDPIPFNLLIAKLKKENKFHDQTIELFRHSVLELSIVSFDERGEELTEDSVIGHLHGELKFENNTYFYIDKEWYFIEPDFLIDLNKACSEVVKQCWQDDLLQEVFDITNGEEERDFNKKFCNKNSTWVFDTVTPQNIEACDILIEKDDMLHVVHVKKGFNNNMRDLTAQVIISAKRILQTIKSDYYYIELLENQTKKGLKSESEFVRKLADQNFPQGGLKKLFERKDEQIAFCLAFVDTAQEERIFKDHYENFESNIAKYALVNLKKEIQGMGFKFKLIQIQRC